MDSGRKTTDGLAPAFYLTLALIAGVVALGAYYNKNRPDITGVVTGEAECYRIGAKDGPWTLPVYSIMTSDGKRIKAAPYSCEQREYSGALPDLDRGHVVSLHTSRLQQPVRDNLYEAPNYYLLRPDQVSITGKLSQELVPEDKKPDADKGGGSGDHIRLRDIPGLLRVLNHDLKRKFPN